MRRIAGRYPARPLFCLAYCLLLVLALAPCAAQAQPGGAGSAGGSTPLASVLGLGTDDDVRFDPDALPSAGVRSARASAKGGSSGLFAAAQSGTYSISYDLAGGSVTGTNPGFYSSDGPEATLINPTRTHYDFLGWSGTGLAGRTNTTVTIPVGSTGDRAYTANWMPAFYNISYRLSGGNGNGNPEVYTVETPAISLSEPTRDGYAFVGWSGTDLVGAANMEVTIPQGTTGDRSYVAHWAVVPYTISYDLAGGTAHGNPETYNVESASFALSDPEQPGYEFVGWSGTGLTGDANKGVGIPRGSFGDRSYVAHWESSAYMVRYNVNAGGERTAGVTPTQEAKGYNTELGTLPTPTWPGHTFLGWFTAAEGGEQVTSSTLVLLPDTTYYAHWQADPHRVDFDAGEGVVVGVASVSGLCGDAVEPPSATRDGHAFVGWYTDEEGGTRVVDWRIPAQDSTYHARWWAYGVDDFGYAAGRQTFVAPVTGTYRLEAWGAQGGFRSNAAMGGRGGYSTGVIGLAKGEVLYVYVDGSGQHYGWNGGGARVGMSSGGGATDMRLGSTSLYARLIVAGGGGSDGAHDMPGGAGGGLAGADGTGEHGTGGQGGTPTDPGEGSTGSGVTVAAFGQGGAGVRGNGGVGGAGGGGWQGGAGVYPDGSGDNDRGGGGGSGYVWTQASSSLYPGGCLLDGSSYLSEASTVSGDEYFPSTSGDEERGHLGDGHARVTMLSYSGSHIVVYDANGGLVDGGAELMSYVGEGESLGTLPEPRREGYLFVGWYTEVAGGGKVAGAAIPTANSTYYAHWSQLSSSASHDDGVHALTFDAQGGSVGGGASLTLLLSEGDALDEPPTPTWTGEEEDPFLFVGWYTEASGGERVATAAPTDDVTYYAHWARLAASGSSLPGHHAITLVANADGATINGEATATLLVLDGDTLDSLPKPARENYLFTGWYTRSSGGGKVKSVTPSGGAIYYAHWSLVATADFSFAALGEDVGAFEAPISGTYLLEAWGADGGPMVGVSTFPSVAGGKGGYSQGEITLAKGEKLYVTAGEAGYFYDHYSYHEGTWNGGGEVLSHNTGNWHRALGGGATHVATALVGDGQLANYEDDQGLVVLVAGGGGGAAGSLYAGKTTDGGSGGGRSGATATYNNGSAKYVAPGGGQTAGSAGTFGQGAGRENGSGGGGWYGGGASALAGGGGSGRVGGLTCVFAANGTDATGTFEYEGETRPVSGRSMQGDLVGVPDKPGDDADGYARVMLVTPSEGRAVTLDAQGGAVEGSAAITLLVDAGEALGDLPDAERDGYEFAGWYTGTEGGTRVTADASTEGGEATYYARWSNSVYATHSVSLATSGTGFVGVSPTGANGRLGDVVEVSVSLLPGYDTSRLRANGVVVPLESREDGSWVWRYTIGDDDADIELTVEPTVYSITYDLPEGAENDPDNPVSYTVESPAITFGAASMSGNEFLGWYNVGGERISDIPAGSVGNFAMHAYFDVSLYELSVPRPSGQEGGTDGVLSVRTEGTAAGVVTAGGRAAVIVAARQGWRVSGWVATADGTALGSGDFEGEEGESGGEARATVLNMPSAKVEVEVVMERASIPQVVAVRWQMPDGTWSTDPGGGSLGVVSSDVQAGDPSVYVEHHTESVWYGESFSPRVAATAVYQAAGSRAGDSYAAGGSYVVTEEHTTYVDVPRKVADVTFRYRLQGADGSYGAWVDGQVAANVRVGATALWSPSDAGLDAAVYERVTGSAAVGAAGSAGDEPASPTVDITVDRRTYVLSVAHDGHFLSVSGGGTYRVGQAGIAVSAAPMAGRYFVYWDGDVGPASADGLVGGLDAPDSPSASYTMGAADAAIVATSRGVRYTVVVDANGGEAAFETYAASYDETFEVPDPILKGHALASWDIAGMDDGEHTLYAVGGAPTTTNATALAGVSARSFKNLRTTPGTVVSLRAHWAPATYTVAFDGNGATSGDMSAQAQARTYGVGATLPRNSYRRQYYTFEGWATSEARAAEGVVDYVDGEDVAEPCDDPAPDGTTVVTLWAVWKEIAHPVILRDGLALTWSGDLWEGAELPVPTLGHRRLVGWAASDGSVVGLPGGSLADVLERLRNEG